MPSHGRIRFKLRSPTLPVCVSPIEDQDANHISRVPNVAVFGHDGCKGLRSDSRRPLDHELLLLSRASPQTLKSIQLSAIAAATL